MGSGNSETAPREVSRGAVSAVVGEDQASVEEASSASSSFFSVAATKPAASAASVELNQTSAILRSYHGEAVVWYLIASALPLMS